MMSYLKSFVGRFYRALTAPFRFILNAPTIFMSAPRRLMGLSLPLRVALITAISLLVVLLIHFFVVELREDSFTWRDWFRNHGVMAICLIIVIPIVTYYTLKLWLQGDTSRFPDVDAAWKAGLSALHQNGLDPMTTPVFLVLGAADAQQIRAVFDASRLRLEVDEVPKGRHPLRWFACEQAIFLVCHDVGLLGKVNQLATAGGAVAMAQDVTATMQPAGQGIRGTLVADGGSQESAFGGGDAKDSDVSESLAPDDPLRGTMVPGIRQTLAPGAGTETSGGAGRPAVGRIAGLTRQEKEEPTERLRYLCQLIVRARQPLCPINGILTLLSVQVIENIMAAREVQDAVANDLHTLHDSLNLCAPVVAMVVGMEEKGGFFELVRRVGEKSRTRRFGKGFDVWNRPTEEQLDALSTHACGAFEDWVYFLFQEPGGMNKPGNRKLYNLLCEIRLRLRARIKNILINGYGYEPSPQEEREQPALFGGCYFAATGASEDRQAFVHDVCRRMIDLQDEVEWSTRALRTDLYFNRLAQFGMLIDGILLIALVVFAAGWYWGFLPM